MALEIQTPGSLWLRRWTAALIDVAIESACGAMGAYFGAMVAALVMVLHEVSPQMTQRSIWVGMVAGFFFWLVAASWINRVLIQGFTRATLGKKFMEIEIRSLGAPVSWQVMMKHWLSATLAGELRVVLAKDPGTSATVHPIRSGESQKDSDKKAA